MLTNSQIGRVLLTYRKPERVSQEFNAYIGGWWGSH